MRDLFDATGSLREAYDRVDWAATALGAPSTWGPALRSALDLALNTRFAVTLFWGPEFTLVYNQAYAVMIDDKHPSALGSRAQDVFPEIWDVIGPMLEGVRGTKVASWSDNQQLFMNRQGFDEETYFTFSYSPVTDDDGGYLGVIDIAAETTREVIDRRRLELLRRLGRRLAGLDDPGEVVRRAVELLRADTADVAGIDVRETGPDSATDTGRALPTPTDLVPGEIRIEAVPGGTVAWLLLAAAPGQPAGDVLAVRLSPHLPPDESYLSFLQLIGTTLSRAKEAATVKGAERAIAAAEHEMSETLQRALLTTPVHPIDLDVAVRYQPAVEQARVGGDWYDTFLLPNASTALVVGDVSGHDRFAAAAMAQIRNLIRGISYTTDLLPSAVLHVADRAIRGLGVGTFATALVAHVEPRTTDGRSVTWSSAGHLPPVVIEATGRARMLLEPPEALLGLRADSPRTDHTVRLEPGATLVLYTDGLIERRHVGLDEVQANLVEALHGHHVESVDAICDHLLDEFDGAGDDDVALIVVRVR